MPLLVLATRNTHKTREVAQILGARFVIADLTEHPDVPGVAETGSTFEENATLKAVAASRILEGWIVADDSGLEVPVLGGAPGIRSARYAGENASDSENMTRLLADLGLADTSLKRREARFCCSLVLARAGTVLQAFHGVVEGRITLERHDGGGFGYDPVFAPAGYSQTFAELGDSTKNRISHRTRAVEKLREFFESTEVAPA